MLFTVITMLMLSLGIAMIAAGFLAFEWRVLQDNALLFWSAGFAAITVGCSLTPLRLGGAFLLGVWVANGLLVVAHVCFLHGAARFVGRRISNGWLVPLIVWPLLLLAPAEGDRTQMFVTANSILVGIYALKSAQLLLAAAAQEKMPAAKPLGIVFLIHGIFYCAKVGVAFVPGAFVNIVHFTGYLIHVSLFEGIMVEVLLALLMAASVRLRREYEIAALADRDPLTGLLNRRAFESRAKMFLRAAALHQSAGALMLLDVDRFKSVNDTLGHGFGDRLLIALATVLNSVLPERAVLARLGGDEFVVLLPELDSSAAARLGNAICAEFAELAGPFRNVQVRTSVSIGAALIADGEMDLITLMERADAALYEAKRRGRNQLCIWTSVPSDVVHESRVAMPVIPELSLVRARA
jgi:diguanylate cyclase (GGDEF)-like protein